MKKILPLACCLSFVFFASAQLANNGATLYLSSGATVSTDLSIKNSNSGTINNLGLLIGNHFTTETSAETKGAGTYRVGGDWLNSSTFTANTSTVILNGGTGSSVTSGGDAFYNLDINKTSGIDVSLLDAMSISNSLNFIADNNKINIGANELSIAPAASLTGYDANDYIITASTGFLSKEQLTGSFTFPIGNDNLTYNPLTVTQTGTTDNINVRVLGNVWMDGLTGALLTDEVVDATWEVTEDVAGGSNLSLTAQWALGDELTAFDRGNASIHQYISPDWIPSTFGPAAGSNPYTLTNGGFTSTGLFSIANLNALPVEMVAFDGTVEERANHLFWETVSEVNTSHFEVESSADGALFRQIGEVAAKGNTSESTHYDFDDLNPNIITYYRLKIVDFDDSYEFSPTIILKREKSNVAAFELFPNPAHQMVQISTQANQGEEIKIAIVDAKGRVLKMLTKQAGTAGEFNSIIDVSMIPPGVYYAKLIRDGQISAIPFIIQ